MRTSETTYDHTEKAEIESLLLGRTLVKVDDHTLCLDDGTVLTLPDTDGGCACSAGCYDLTELNGVDNVITKVEFVDSPAGDDEDGDGHYKTFVFADNRRVNLATWEGSDGNGYYGTGYSIHVTKPDVIRAQAWIGGQPAVAAWGQLGRTADRPKVCCEFHDRGDEPCAPDDRGGYCCDACPTLAGTATGDRPNLAEGEATR